MSEWKEKLARRLWLVVKLIGIYMYHLVLSTIWLILKYFFIWLWRIVRKKTVAITLLVVLIGGMALHAIFPRIDLVPNLLTFGKNGGEAQQKTVDRLLEGSWEEQQEAVRDSLAGAGIAVLKGDADPKPGTLFVIPPELTLLTADASRRASGGHLSLDEVADLFQQAGFPFAEGRDPALTMQSAIRKWVLAAQEKPKLEGSYVPLFMQAMAQRQVPAVDLTAEDWDPADYRLTHLEFEMFLGAFIQALPSESRTASLWERLLGEKAYAEENTAVCSNLKSWLGDWGTRQGGDAGAVKFTVESIGILVAELTGKGVEVLSQLVAGVILPIISMALKLLKLAMLYWSVDVTLEATPGELHRPASNEAGSEIAYLAKVGVNEAKYKAYVEGWSNTPLAKKIKDCLSTFGFPVPSDTGELAADVDRWSVEWNLFQNGGPHATIGQSKNKFELLGQLQMKVNRTSDIAGEAKLIADVAKEQVKDHDGEERTGTVVARAQVETSAPPAIGTFLNAYKVGEGAAKSGIMDLLALTDTLLDVLAGWYQEMVTPEAYVRTQVAYHVPKSDYAYKGWISMASERNEKETLPGGEKKTRVTAHARMEAELVVLGDGQQFEIRGVGTMKLSGQFNLFNQTGGDCTNGKLTQTQSSYGTGRHSSDITINSRITRTGSDAKGYTFAFRPIFQSRTSGQYDVRTVYHTQMNGCMNGGKPSYASYQREERDTHPYSPVLTPLELTMEADRPFPKTISGGRTSTNERGETIIWTYKFDRLESAEK